MSGPLSPEHRARIAEAQRKRIAARKKARLLAGTDAGVSLAHQQSRERKLMRITEAHRLAGEGRDVLHVARELGVSEGLVAQYLATDLEALAEDSRGPVVLSRCAHCGWSVELPVRDAADAFRSHECVAVAA